MLQKFEKFVVVALCVGVIWALSAPPAAGDDWDKKTTITVNQPFEVGGKVLPAGTYVLKVLDLAAHRTVVRVFGTDETTIYATVIGIRDFRLRPTDEGAVTFYESEPARPRALHAWFYPSYQSGIEFVYRKARAVEIAKVAQEHVIAIDEPELAAAPPPEPPVGPRVEPLVEPTVEELLREPLVVIEPGGEEVELAEVHPEIPIEPLPEPVPVLPKTATPFPLIALLGLLAAGAASMLRLFRM
jgi:hypothetical protein